MPVFQFEIEDTGPGIAAEEMNKLFEPFEQTKTGQESQQGTGLGLPISRKFVQMMGGDITVSSTPDFGSKFAFDIQIRLAEPTEIKMLKPHKKVIGLAPNQPQYRILVVDDRADNCLVIDRLLSPLGILVREARNGQEAIAVWEDWQPHLIWMDMRMPVLNGYEATGQIKSHPKGQETVIIALTASTFEEERATVLSAGCDDFVRKPFREEVIWEKMAQHLSVRYVYAVSPISASAPPVSEKLTSVALAVMPTEWLADLHQAAAQLDAKLIEHLIAQIPEEYTSLAKTLLTKVNEFDFDQIMNLTEQIPTL